jgi:hypothetical protein
MKKWAIEQETKTPYPTKFVKARMDKNGETGKPERKFRGCGIPSEVLGRWIRGSERRGTIIFFSTNLN